ncbi:NF-kappa-B inhibitor cactus [Diorhabda sublineata]|uniref:NF-kappa-B inhibitor cactus n=1 Tax=Diorhabda sublineata TaxID=1163346 RepID=UPI0024E04826|nr:NF-kappa-B inhibitor cactus [Diorhabda sublineata]
MSKQGNFTDSTATANEKKAVYYESSTVDSGFLSGEISEEISDIGFNEKQKPINTQDSITEEEEEKKVRPMLLDSGVYLSDSFSRISIKETDSGTNDLNNPKRSQTPVDSSTKSKQNRPAEDVSWKIYYEQDEEGDTHLHIAIVQGFLEVALALIRAVPHPKLLDTPNDHNQTPLHLAVETGQYKIARWLIVAGAKPCPRGPQGESPLHIAARKNDHRSVRAIAEPVQVQEREQLALSYQAHMCQPCDFDQWNFLGQTCVHVASMHGHVEVLRHLIWYGANVNAREGCMGLTALHYGVRTGNEELVKFLLDCKNIDVECISYNGKDALEYNHHFVSSKIRQTLLDKGFSSPYSSEDEFDSDGEEDEMIYENTHIFSAHMVNASA